MNRVAAWLGAGGFDRRARSDAAFQFNRIGRDHGGRGHSHGSPDFARDVAFQKIESRIKGATMAAEKLGVH